MGVGVGGEFPKEFEACGVPVKERGARTDESLEVMHRLFTEENVEFEGRFTKLSGVTLKPKTIQKPPPIWVSGRSQGAMRRTARFAKGWIPYMYTPEMLAESMESINKFDVARETPVVGGLYIFFAVHESSDTAMKMCADRLSQTYNQDFSKLVGKYALGGNPEQCVARLKEYMDAGARTIVFASACPPEYLEENQRLLAEAVLPAFR